MTECSSVLGSVGFRGIQFPHVSRKFSARLISSSEKSVLWAALTSLFLFNVYAKINGVPVYWKQLEQALQKPFSAVAHEALAHSFWQQGLISEAKSELHLAQSLPKENNVSVLGASTEDELTAWAAEPKRIRDAYDYWKTVVVAKPDFHDAYLSLAAAAYQLGLLDEAKSAANIARTLHPNSPEVARLVEFFGNLK